MEILIFGSIIGAVVWLGLVIYAVVWVRDNLRSL